MKGLPKSYIKKWGVSKKAWREYKKSKSSGKTKVSRTGGKKTVAKRRYTRRRTKRRSRSNKWGVAGTVLKLAAGAWLGNRLGLELAKRIDPEGVKPLYRAGGAVAGAILVKKLAGRSGLGAAFGTGAAAMLAGHAALDFEQYMKARQGAG